MRPRHTAIAVVLLGVLATVVWLPPFYLVLLSEILIWALFALSFNLVYGYTGLLSLGQSLYFGLGAYGVGLSLLYLSDSVLIALLIGVLAPMIAAAIIGAIAVRVQGHGFIIFTAVTALVAYGLMTNTNLSPITGGDQGRTFALAPIWVVDLANPLVAFGVVTLVVALVFAGFYWLIRTPLGMGWQLVRDNPTRAAELGYSVRKLRWLSFSIAGALAGLSGVLFALFNRFVDASLFHWILSADVIVWVLVGGAGTLWGPVLGAFGFNLLEEALSVWWPSGYPLLLGLSLIVVVRFFPQGLGRWRPRIFSSSKRKT